MDNSILFSKFIGPFIIITGISVLFNIKIYHKIVEEFFKDPALVYITGLITFVAGLAVVIFHNTWAADWTIIITLIGWLTLIKGAWLVVLPGTLLKIAKAWIKDTKRLAIHCAIMIAIGIFLTAKGY